MGERSDRIAEIETYLLGKKRLGSLYLDEVRELVKYAREGLTLSNDSFRNAEQQIREQAAYDKGYADGGRDYVAILTDRESRRLASGVSPAQPAEEQR